jgi:carboxylesterase type B
VELPFVFDTADLMGVDFDPAERQLAVWVAEMWSAFAATGAPKPAHPAAAPWPISWPARTAGTDTELLIQTPTPVVKQNDRTEFCDFWDDLGYSF